MTELPAETRKVDVLIVGSGPAAAACAKRLVDAGYEVQVVADAISSGHKLLLLPWCLPS